jgi:hypothetical protein
MLHHRVPRTAAASNKTREASSSEQPQVKHLAIVLSAHSNAPRSAPEPAEWSIVAKSGWSATASENNHPLNNHCKHCGNGRCVCWRNLKSLGPVP